MKVIVTKPAAEKYSLRGEGFPWADIVLSDMGENRGQIFIQSDYGDYSYFWNSMGGTLKEFLITAPFDYVESKFSAGKRHFFADDTYKLIKKDLLDAYKGRCSYISLTREQYDDAVDSLESFKRHEVKTEGEYYTLFHSRRWDFGVLYEDPPCPPIVTGHHPWLKALFKKIWPVFIRTLKKELKDEKRGIQTKNKKTHNRENQNPALG